MSPNGDLQMNIDQMKTNPSALIPWLSGGCRKPRRTAWLSVGPCDATSDPSSSHRRVQLKFCDVDG
jgi:hypothetical protein